MRKDKQKQPHALSVRPPDHVREKLAEAAKAAGRTLTKEMERRLEDSLEGAGSAAPGAFAGWPAADAANFQALGEIAAQFFARVTLAAGAIQSPQRRLGLLRPALMALLDELGAEKIAASEEVYFDRAARLWVHDEPFKTWAAHFGVEREESPIAKAARQLGAEDAPIGKKGN